MDHTLPTKGSCDSFHSSHSQPPSDSSQPNTNLHAAALQAAGLSPCDIDAFLNDPLNRETVRVNSPPQKKQKTSQANSSAAPEQLGTPKTTHNVPAFHHLCQERGLVANFDIGGDQPEGFGGAVTVGGQMVTSEQRWRTKKEAKEALAELAIPVVKEMGAGKKDKGEQPAAKGKGEPEKNWVGMLLEYQNAIDPTHSSPGPVYTEYATPSPSSFASPPSFACTLTLPNPPNAPLTLGSPTTPYPTKKSARNHAAKEAVHHLISTGALTPDGKPANRKPKGLAAGPTVHLGAKGLAVEKDASYANRVNDLVPLLGMTTPTYRFEPASAAAPNIFSGAAFFSGDATSAHPGLKAAVGEVRNVFGKKNAKEECARGVWAVLREVAKGRGVEVEEVVG